MSNDSDFAEDLRAGLVLSAAQVQPPIGLADRLIAAATDSPFSGSAGRRRRASLWLGPVAAAAALLAVAIATLVLGPRDHNARPLPAAPISIATSSNPSP